MKKIIVLLFTIVFSLSIMTTTVLAKEDIIWLEEGIRIQNMNDKFIFNGLICFEKNGMKGFMDREGNVIVEPIYSNITLNAGEEICVVNKNKKKGLYNLKKRKQVTELKYDTISPFNGGYSIFSLNGKKGYLGINGEELLFNPKLRPVLENGKYGYANYKGEVIIPAKYDKAEEFVDGLAIVGVNYKQGIIDTDGREVLALKYDYISQIGRDYQIMKGKSIGLFLRDKKIVIEPKYSLTASSFSDGLLWVLKGDKYSFIKADGKEAFGGEYDMVKDFSEGLVGVAKISNYELNGATVPGYKYGFLDKTGKLVIDYEYEDCSVFSEGLNPVMKNLEYGYIDKKGKVVIPNKFDWASAFEDGTALIYNDGRNGLLRNPLINKERIRVDMMASPQKISVDGKIVDGMEVYLYKGHNYFKLRDIAKLAKATDSQFSVDWIEQKSLISLERGKAYKELGTELKSGDGKDKKGIHSSFAIEVDGREVFLDAYNVDGQTYYQIRPLGRALGFGVSWDAANGIVKINMDK